METIEALNQISLVIFGLLMVALSAVAPIVGIVFGVEAGASLFIMILISLALNGVVLGITSFLAEY